uniref:Uncharacterized protein n=1 Tax=Tetradesmus obliquus TaxID=3088 RepID=A0A383VB22_TETOB|eukprot:jgi/Sobl393_1/17511/SZX62765.1
MLSKDQMPAEQLRSSMDALSQQLLQNIGSYSSTELSAFTEACRQIGYFHQHAFSAAVQHLAPTASSIAADELPSLLWACAQLADANSSSSSSSQVASSSPAATDTSSSSSGGRSRTTPVPSNDGVRGSVSSSKVAGLPGVVDFVLGAAQVLTSDIDDVASEELPVLAAALAAMEYRDPFLLTALAEAALERRGELTQPELLALLGRFASMGRWFFDNRLLDGLAAEVVTRAQQGLVSQDAVQAVAQSFAAINHSSKPLKQYLELLSSSSSSK